MKILILSTLLLLSSSLALAAPASPDDCTTVDLNDSGHTGIMQAIPIYDQDGTGMCYAYAAAQLVDYERMENSGSRDASQLISPIYAAYAPIQAPYSPNYNENRGIQGKPKRPADQFFRDMLRDPISISNGTVGQGGNQVADAIKGLNLVGACSDNDVQKLFEGVKKVATVDPAKPVTDAQILYFSDALFARSKRLEQANGDAAGVAWTEQQLDMQLNYGWLTQKTFNSCELRKIYENAGYDKVPAVTIVDAIFRNCQAKPLKTGNARLRTTNIGNDAAISSAVNKALSSDRPAAITFCSTVLDKPGYRGLGTNSPLRGAIGNRKEDCQMHSALVVGRKEIVDASGAKQCNVLIRNSWGPNWKPSKATQCACLDRNKKYHDNCPDRSQADTYVGCWYKRSEIMPNTSSVDAYQDK